MAVAKVIEVLAQSDEGWEDAVRVAVENAAKSVRNIQTVYIKEFQATVKDGMIDQYRVNAKITFVVED